MPSIFDWSYTAASNNNSDPIITWSDGQAPSTVDDSGRAMMQRVAELRGDFSAAGTVGGSANAITLLAKSGVTVFFNGWPVSFKAASANTGATTLNVNSIGAKSVRKMTTSGDVALAGGEIQANGVYYVYYSTAANGAAGGWVLINPTIAITDLVSATDLPWLSKPIGEPFPLMTDKSAPTPSKDATLYRYIELTAGLTGSGQYNEGVLTSESTTGSAPLVQSTATISLSGSPLNGQTVRLINTEERFLRAAASPGTAQADAFQGHYHDPLAPLTSYVGGRTSGTIIGAGINFGNVNTTGAPATDGTNGTPRTANETRPKNLGVKFFLRIK